jgi:hypothetical protein
MTTARLPMITTLLHPAGDHDSDDGVLRRERVGTSDSALGRMLSLLVPCCPAHAYRGPPVHRPRRAARRSVGMIVTSAIIVFQSP